VIVLSESTMLLLAQKEAVMVAAEEAVEVDSQEEVEEVVGTEVVVVVAEAASRAVEDGELGEAEVVDEDLATGDEVAAAFLEHGQELFNLLRARR
jgi:hypothetical protein